MKTIIRYVILLSLLVVARISRAQCVTSLVAAKPCTVPGGATVLTDAGGGNANVTIAGGTYYYGGSAGITNLNLSGGTLYYSSSGLLNGLNQSGGVLLYAGSGTIANLSQSGGTVQVCSGSLTLGGNLNGGSFLVAAGSSLTVSSAYSLQNSSLFTNYGTATFQNGLSVAGAAGTFVNAASGTLSVPGQVFLNGPGLVNLGSATFGTLVVNGAGTACLGPNSQLSVTTFQTNDNAGSFTVSPATAQLACVRIANYGNFNALLYTGPAKLGVCKAGTATAAELAKYGTAQVTQNCSSCQTVLLVVLVSFAAQAPAAPGGPVQLRWATASEVNHQGFVVERSADGSAFEARSALLPGVGGQLLGRAYAWADADPLPGTSYYRLRILDRDGRAEYSPTVAAHAAALAEIWAWAYQPDADHLRLDWRAPAEPAAPLTWQLLDVQGRRVRQHSPPAATGTATLELAGLPPGAYWLRVQQGSRCQLLRVARP